MLSTNRLLLAILVALSFSSLSFAGRKGWISSGGEIFLYDRNPWFVKNVDTVNYCVVIDEASVTAAPSEVRNAIRVAIDYWKNEMPAPLSPSPGFANIATQNFIENSVCEDSTDLRFKVGYGALTKEEVEGLEDPSVYVGVAVRTEYDQKTLKGKGFIYISSDKGPQAYPNKGELRAEAWRYPKLLQYAFIHELGHIFGIPHTGTGVMSEIFLNHVLHARFSNFYLSQPLQPFLLEPRQFEVCKTLTGGDFNAIFFMVDIATSCLKFEAEDAAASSWKVFASAKKTNPNYIQFGRVKMNTSSRTDLAAKPAVILQLPPEQVVFGVREKTINSFMIGPLFVNRNTSGHFETMNSHKPYPLQVQLSADTVIFTGVVGGRLLPVLVYAPPSLLKMLLPIP